MFDKMGYDMHKKRLSLAKQMPRSPQIVKGSLVTLRRECGKPNCRCRKGQKHVSLYLSQSHQGKTAMTYIPEKYEREIKQGVQRHKKLIRIINELTIINLQMIKHKE